MGLISYKRHRFPKDVIQHAVWPYFRFTMSLYARRAVTKRFGKLNFPRAIGRQILVMRWVAAKI